MTKQDLLNAYRCGYVSLRQLEDMADRAAYGERWDDFNVIQEIIDQVTEGEICQ